VNPDDVCDIILTKTRVWNPMVLNKVMTKFGLQGKSLIKIVLEASLAIEFI
jgi:hypothetical protein